MKALLVPIALALAGFGLAAASSGAHDTGRVAVTISARNPYVLVRGDSNRSESSLETLEELRERYSGDYLWFRKGAKGYIVQDESVLDRAEGLFKPLKTLEPDRRELEARRQVVERDEEAVDREQEELDQAAENRDEEEDDDAEAPEAPDPDLARRRTQLERQAREIASRERDLDREERALDEREDAIERNAEKALWDLIDDSLRRGIARPAE
jgi:DNA repair exonuclease SbcCD ATPase subunit